MAKRRRLKVILLECFARATEFVGWIEHGVGRVLLEGADVVVADHTRVEATEAHVRRHARTKERCGDPPVVRHTNSMDGLTTRAINLAMTGILTCDVRRRSGWAPSDAHG